MTERRRMTEDELLAIAAMRGVTYPVASWDKRFMGALSSGETISQKESVQLWRLFIKYRRQTNFPDKPRLMQLASSLAAPDFRKIAAAKKVEAKALPHCKNCGERIRGEYDPAEMLCGLCGEDEHAK